MERRKRNKIFLTLIILIVIVITGFYVLKALVNKRIELNLIHVEPAEVGLIGMELPKDSAVIKHKDTHGGFHGDGELYLEVQLTKDGVKQFTADAKRTQKWNSIPLPDDIKIILYGGDNNGTSYYIGDDRMTGDIPKDIKNGIYYIRDRFAENYPKEKNIDINQRAAYNVTIAILDSSTRKLYIYELDT